MNHDKKFNLLNNISFCFSFTDSLSLPFMLREPIDLPDSFRGVDTNFR